MSKNIKIQGEIVTRARKYIKKKSFFERIDSRFIVLIAKVFIALLFFL